MPKTKYVVLASTLAIFVSVICAPEASAQNPFNNYSPETMIGAIIGIIGSLAAGYLFLGIMINLITGENVDWPGVPRF